MSRDISVVIPSIGRLTLKACVEILLEQVGESDEIIVVDNSRQLRVAEVLGETARKRSVRIIRESRIGPAFSVNRGIKKAKNAYIVMIDDDCLPRKGWVKNLKKMFPLAKRQIVMGKSINTGKSIYTRAYQRFIDAAIKLSLAESLESYQVGRTNTKRKRIRFFDKKNAVGRTEDLKETLFDPRFNKHEDTDFLLRWHESGGVVLYDPGLVVEHLQEETLGSFLKDSLLRGVAAGRLEKKWKSEFAARKKAKELFPEQKDLLGKSPQIIPQTKNVLDRRLPLQLELLILTRILLYNLGKIISVD